MTVIMDAMADVDPSKANQWFGYQITGKGSIYS